MKKEEIEIRLSVTSESTRKRGQESYVKGTRSPFPLNKFINPDSDYSSSLSLYIYIYIYIYVYIYMYIHSSPDICFSSHVFDTCHDAAHNMYVIYIRLALPSLLLCPSTHFTPLGLYVHTFTSSHTLILIKNFVLACI